MFDMNTHKYDVRPVPNGEFEAIQLDDNHIRLVKIRSRIPFDVRLNNILPWRSTPNQMGKWKQPIRVLFRGLKQRLEEARGN